MKWPQIVAKAMNRSLSAEQKDVVDRLACEFSTELETMGVKVDNLQRQLNDMVKLSGNARVRYFHTYNTNDFTDYRGKINIDAKVNDNIKANVRLSNGNISSMSSNSAGIFDTANVTFNVWGTPVTFGRHDYALGSGFLLDITMNGISINLYGLKAFGGILQDTGMSRVYGAEYGFDLGKSRITADYLKDVSNNKQYYAANAAVNVIDGITINGEYAKIQTDSATAKAYGLKFMS